MSGSNKLSCIGIVIMLAFGISAGVLAATVSITSPSNLALFQHNSGVADIPVTAVASGIPTGGGIRFVLDGNTQTSIVIKSSPYSYTFRNVGLGEHSIAVYITNSSGSNVGPSDTRPTIGVGDLIVCVGDSITAGEDDDVTSDDWSADGRNGPHIDPVDGLSFGGFEPILNDLLTAARKHPHSVINEGLGEETSAGGVNRLPGIIAQYPSANTWLIAYGTNDIRIGISPSAFENNLATMVQRIQSANPNAVVYIPKILYGGQSNIGTFIDYTANLIYGANNLYWGADMFTMFENNLNSYNRMTGQPGTWYAVDTVPHPNGIGYQQIAAIWEEALDGNVFVVSDGLESSMGRLTSDKFCLTGVDKLGLGPNDRILVSTPPQ